MCAPPRSSSAAPKRTQRETWPPESTQVWSTAGVGRGESPAQRDPRPPPVEFRCVAFCHALLRHPCFDGPWGATHCCALSAPMARACREDGKRCACPQCQHDRRGIVSADRRAVRRARCVALAEQQLLCPQLVDAGGQRRRDAPHGRRASGLRCDIFGRSTAVSTPCRCNRSS